MSLSFDEPIGLSLLKLACALQAVSLALIRLGMALGRWLDHAFNPNQPRVPAGHPVGGHWTDRDEAGVIPVADNGRPANDRYLNQHIMANHIGKSDIELITRIERETRARGIESEPPSDCRRPFGLSYAAMGCSSSMA